MDALVLPVQTCTLGCCGVIVTLGALPLMLTRLITLLLCCTGHVDSALYSTARLTGTLSPTFHAPPSVRAQVTDTSTAERQPCKEPARRPSQVATCRRVSAMDC